MASSKRFAHIPDPPNALEKITDRVSSMSRDLAMYTEKYMRMVGDALGMEPEQLSWHRQYHDRGFTMYAQEAPHMRLQSVVEFTDNTMKVRMYTEVQNVRTD